MNHSKRKKKIKVDLKKFKKYGVVYFDDLSGISYIGAD